MKIRNIFLFAITAIALAGCSGSPSKEEAAVRRLTDRKKPGYVRVLNLTNTLVTLKDGARPMATNVDTDAVSRFQPIGEGKKKLTLDVSGKTTEVEVDVKSEGASTIVFGGDGKVLTVISDETRYPTDVGNVKSWFLSADGSAASAGSATVKGGGQTVTLKAGTVDSTLSTGRWDCDLGGTVNVEDKCAYSFIFVQQDGKFKAFLLKNTINDVPTAAGNA